jgi:Mrp family chromosome partitioning ATPase
MGKMLETLKLGDTRRAPVAVSKPAEETPPVQDCVTDWEIAEEVPFVEVGGPNKKVELSPGLSKHPPQAAPQPPHAMTEPVVAAAKPSVVYLTPVKPMTAAYAPWPTQTPALAKISAEVIAFHHPDHPASKEHAALLQTLRANLKTGAGAILFVGAKPHVGSGTVLLNLAVLASQAEKLRVVLIDAGAQKPDLAHRLGHSAPITFLDVIDGAAALEQAIVKTNLTGLHVLPVGANVPPSAEAMSWLHAWLKTRYDLILIDGPCADDASMSAYVPNADGIYLVLPRGTQPPDGIAQTLHRMGSRLCGLIHTHFEV